MRTLVALALGFVLGAVRRSPAARAVPRPQPQLRTAVADAPRQRRSSAYAGALAVTLMLVPGTAAALTAGLVLGDPIIPKRLEGSFAWYFLFATALALGAWVVVSPLLHRYGTADGANPVEYGRLLRERDELRLWAEACDSSWARAEAEWHLDAFDRDLGVGSTPPCGLVWTSANGYITAWRRLEAADEALLGASPRWRVASEGQNDELRLTNSKIGNRTTLLRKLAVAIPIVDPAARPLSLAETAPTAPVRSATLAQPDPEPSEADVRAATAAIQQVRRAINEFRLDRGEGLVRARNNLYATVLFTGTTGYALLGLALISEVSRSVVAAGAAFYLVGALIGLFRQLRAASARDTVLQEDYGLSHVRLIHTPLFSGLAAVGGVVAIALLPGLAAAASTSNATDVPELTEIFDLKDNTIGILWAALFGLTPSLLVTRLQREVEEYKSDLASSEPSEQPTGGG